MWPVALKLKKMAYVSFSGVAIINPKVAGFESKERLRNSEIKERQGDDHQPQSRWFWEQRTAT